MTKNGTLQNEWINQTLILKQGNESNGTYQLLDTPYDTIWSSSGTWEAIDEYSFILNDSIPVRYWAQNDSLYLSKVLLWTSIPCDIEDPEIDACPLNVTCSWNFLMTKQNRRNV